MAFNIFKVIRAREGSPEPRYDSDRFSYQDGNKMGGCGEVDLGMKFLEALLALR